MTQPCHLRCGAIGLALVTGALPLEALDPAKAITQYHQDVWTEREGLPQGSVEAILQTRDGYIWIGTRDGLARFDGVRFTVYREESQPGLRANDIRALYQDRSGNLWIGTFNGGVSRFRDGVFTAFGRADGLPSDGVLDILEDKTGDLWMGTWNGVARYRDGRFTAYTSADGILGRNAWSIAAGAEGDLWIATSRGLTRLSEGQFRRFSARDGLPHNNVRTVYLDRQGVLWLGTIGGGVGRFYQGAFTRWNIRDGLIDNKVRALLEDRDGNIWIATWTGLNRFYNGRISRYTREEGFPHDSVDVLYEDREGSLWIGTRGGGLVRLRDAKFTVYTRKEGLVSDGTKCVFETRDGALWIGTDGGGLSRYAAGTFTSFTTRDGLPSNFIWSIGQDQAGQLWVGTAHPPAVCRLDQDQFTPYLEKDGLPIEHGVRVLFGDRAGNLWIGGSGGGLCRLRDGQFTVYSTGDGLTNQLIRVIAQDRNGDLWIGTNQGLYRKREEQFELFTTRDGLAHNAVYAIHQDAEGTLWLGTQGGLTRLREGRFHSYTTRNGLLQNIIYQVLEDDRQTLWMSSNRGVFSLPKRAVDDLDRGNLDSLPCTAYNVTDGMKTTQCEGGSHPAGCRAADGRLWFATVHGVARIDPAHIRRNHQPPPVLIEQVLAGTRQLDPRAPVRLEAGSGELTFHYTALSYVAPEKVQFKYRLIGLEDKWIDAAGWRVAFYNKLPPGNYQFKVKACNSDGVWNEAGAVFAFTLAPHFYQTAWFYFLCGSLVLLWAWSFHRWRLRQAQAKFSLVLAERNRIARELHDTLAQGFAGIAFQLEAVATKISDAPAQAQQHLTLALKMVRHSLAEARRSVLNLRSAALDNGDLALALAEAARQMMADKPVDLQFETSGIARPLPARIENNLLRVGQEAITNSLKYAQPGKLQIQLHYQARHVVLRIQDDGPGFDLAALTSTNGTHFGLLGMRERANQMGARLEINSRPGQGTEVLVEVPLK